MAYLPVNVVERLSVYSYGREPEGALENLHQPFCYDVARRIVARGQLDLCALGCVSRKPVSGRENARKAIIVWLGAFLASAGGNVRADLHGVASISMRGSGAAGWMVESIDGRGGQCDFSVPKVGYPVFLVGFFACFLSRNTWTCQWKPTLFSAFWLALLFGLSVGVINTRSPFLYFQF